MRALHQLFTPCCIIDKPRFLQNCLRMQQMVDKKGVVFRPHVKTLKSLQAAEYYAPKGRPITVSTIAEAKYFAAAGYGDILYAVGLSPNKFSLLSGIQRLAEKFTVTLDSHAAVQALIEYAQHFKQPLYVVLEVDVDDHRAGLLPDSPELLECASALSRAENIHFRGLMTHAGGSYDCFSDAALSTMAIQECERISYAAQRLNDNGVTCEQVSAGSTPTALMDVNPLGVNELRSGVYATFDCVMAGLGICSTSDIAISVLTSIIGHQRTKNWVVVDAGWMALSRDSGTADQTFDCQYGLVCSEEGELLDGWLVTATNQEHGIISHRDGLTPDEQVFGYGKRLRILPIHACATAAQFSEYHVVNNTNQVTETWSKVSGW